MSAGPTDDQLREKVQAELHAVVHGDYRRFLSAPPSTVSSDARGADHEKWMTWFVAVANCHRLSARGRFAEAWLALDELARSLRRGLRTLPGPDGVVRAVVPPPSTGWSDEPIAALVATTVARVIWREQSEIQDLRARAASMQPRDALVEMAIEHRSWTDFDPAHDRAIKRAEFPGILDDRRRDRMLRCATALRQLGRPTAGSVSPRIWHEVGGYEGLATEALARLALRSAPATWCDRPGTESVTVRVGRLRQWQEAHS